MNQDNPWSRFVTLYVWPDDSFCMKEEYDEVLDSWKGEDYNEICISEEALEKLYAIMRGEDAMIPGK